jgi:hypothetical protein
MASRTVLAWDLIGISDGKRAAVTITFDEARKGTIVLYLPESEVEQIGGRRQARRGRQPKKTRKYVLDVPSGSKPIEGVGTAVAAFVG